MALNKKNSRPITVEGYDLRWLFFENSGWNDLTVQSANGEGGKFVAKFAWETKDGSKLPYFPITPAVVVEAVQFGLMNGWNPKANGVPFECRYKNGSFALKSPGGTKTL